MENIKTPVLKVENLAISYKMRRGEVPAVRDVSFEIHPGETLGLVGESGCGKSTTGRAILQLYRPTGGDVYFEGVDLTALKGERLRKMRRRMQMIFQDPYASLNPRMTVGAIVSEPLLIHGDGSAAERRKRCAELLLRVGLDPEHASRYPHEFSGGQRQRIGIARALSLNPKLIVCDEPVSALDVSIQAQIINLLEELQAAYGIAYLLIAHNLAVVRHTSDTIGVMYLGRLVEEAPTEELFATPLHPYTRALLSAVPRMEPGTGRKRIILGGAVPSPVHPPPGCPFHPRCPEAVERCKAQVPKLVELAPGHRCACLLAQASPSEPAD